MLHHFLCRSCDFFIEGCDFTDPAYTAEAPPCGGYLAVDLLLSRPGADHVGLLRTLVPQKTYGILHPYCALKHLETPCLYNVRADDLYELDSDGFEFLKACIRGRPLSELAPHKDFMETCLSEGLMSLGPEPNQHSAPVRPSPIPSLRYLELQLTNRCNLACKHCYLGEPGKTDLPLSSALSVLKEFEEMQGLRVLFSGGEPMLYPDLKALCRALTGFRLRKVLLTNGTLISEKNYPDWSCFDEIQFSLDGLKKAHERLRGKGTFERTMRALEMAGDKGIPVSVATMVHRYNLEDFESMSQQLEALGVVEWNIDVPCSAGRLTQHETFCVPPEVGAPYLAYATGGSRHGGDEPFACGHHLCTVTPGGRVLKCGFYDSRPLGSLEEGLETSWKRANHLPLNELECGPCEHLAYCKGGCRFRAGSPLGRDPVMCAFYGAEANPKKTEEVKAMKIFEVGTRVGDAGECVLGAEDTGSHACYLIYGKMTPREKGRTLKPGAGHEEMILAVKGDFLVSGHVQGRLNEGQAIHLQGEEICWLENVTDKEGVYIISGGHSKHGHH